MVGEVYAGLSSFKVLFDIAKGLIDINDAAARKAAVIELQEKILAAQAAQADLIQTVSTLEAEVARLKDWSADKVRYELKDAGLGTVAYSLKESMANGEPPHSICANCYGKNKRSFLQNKRHPVGRVITLDCHECGSVLVIQGVLRD